MIRWAQADSRSFDKDLSSAAGTIGSMNRVSSQSIDSWTRKVVSYAWLQ